MRSGSRVRRCGSSRSSVTLTEIASEKNSTIVFPLPIDTIKQFLDLGKEK